MNDSADRIARFAELSESLDVRYLLILYYLCGTRVRCSYE